jgi:hypothetical protein
MYRPQTGLFFLTKKEGIPQKKWRGIQVDGKILIDTWVI